MMSKTPETAPNAEDRRIRAQFARALWMADNQGALPDSAEARKAAFGEVRKDYLGKARKYQRMLARRGVVMSLAAAAGAEEAD